VRDRVQAVIVAFDAGLARPRQSELRRSVEGEGA